MLRTCTRTGGFMRADLLARLLARVNRSCTVPAMMKYRPSAMMKHANITAFRWLLKPAKREKRARRFREERVNMHDVGRAMHQDFSVLIAFAKVNKALAQVCGSSGDIRR